MTDKLMRSIQGLLIPPNVTMNETLKSSFETFVDTTPQVTQEIKDTLNSGKMEDFIKDMNNIITLLNSIHARWLEKEAQEIVRIAKQGDKEECRKLLLPFVSNTIGLSINIQVAQKYAADNITPEEIHHQTDIIYNLKAIITRAQQDEFESAIAIFEGLEDISEFTQYEKLRRALLSKAKKLTEVITEEFITAYSKNILGKHGTALKKVLVVDDRPEILVTLTSSLKDYYQVIAVPSGVAALQAVGKQKPDLFILDIDMPVMNGFDLLKYIREIEEFKFSPVFFLTSNSSKECVYKALNSGISDFIVKPINRDLLLSKIATILR